VYINDGEYNVIYNKEVKIGTKRLKEEILTNLENDDISVINTAKALDLGLDVTGMEVAVIYAGKGNPTTQTQRIGRVVRKEGDKTSIIVNIIVKDTQDEKWARRRQINNARFIRHITKIEEIL
jgi:superfamily II DNA or RNA helicase